MFLGSLLGSYSYATRRGQIGGIVASSHLPHEDGPSFVPDPENPMVGYHRLAVGEKRPAEGDLAPPDGDPVLRRSPVEDVDLALLHIQAPPFDLV